jgi:hypothetical protein
VQASSARSTSKHPLLREMIEEPGLSRERPGFLCLGKWRSGSVSIKSISVLGGRPLADIRETGQNKRMAFQNPLPLIAACLALSGCGQAVEELPEILIGATTTGGSNSLCEGGNDHGSPTETASHSPEIVERLRADYPAGSPASKLRTTLLRQGFIIHDGCSFDKTVSWAEFRQRRSNGVATYQAAFGTVYWKQDPAGRVIWATGDIAYTGL